MAHNLKLKLKTLSGFEYKPKPTVKSGSKLVVKDDNGDTLHEGEFKSFTANFMKLLYGNMIGSGTVTATDLNGDSSDIDSFPNVKMNLDGGSTIQKFGIVVGSGSSAVANADNDLTWVSGLTYGAVVVGTPAIDGTTVKLDITREISNSSGSTKTLAEAGLIVGEKAENDENVLIARDLVAVELLTGQKSTWTYSITVDFDGTAGGFVKNFLDSFVLQDWSEILADDSTPASTQFSQRSNHTSSVFDSKIWVVAGDDGSNYLNDVWSSSDGVAWTEVLADTGSPASTQFSQRLAPDSVSYDGKMWVIGGYDGSNYLNDVWSSEDGATWTEVLASDLTPPSTQFSGRIGSIALVFNSKMWIISGNAGTHTNDVWSSEDGETWTEVLADTATPASTQFSQRRAAALAVLDGKMWIVSGDVSGAKLNDVWSSTDGETWTEVLADTATPTSTQFSQRDSSSISALGDKLYLIAGRDSTATLLSDVWSSEDGETWTEESSTNISIRRNQTSVVFHGDIFLAGGNNPSQLNDVLFYGKQLYSGGDASIDSLGITVGTSDASFSSTATALTAKIDDGTGSGELEYATFPDTTYTEEPATDGSKTEMSLARMFTNNSGASITINEVGLESVNGLLCRIVLDSSITIADGASETILIQFETEV